MPLSKQLLRMTRFAHLDLIRDANESREDGCKKTTHSRDQEKPRTFCCRNAIWPVSTHSLGSCQHNGQKHLPGVLFYFDHQDSRTDRHNQTYDSSQYLFARQHDNLDSVPFLLTVPRRRFGATWRVPHGVQTPATRPELSSFVAYSAHMCLDPLKCLLVMQF